MHNCSLFDSFFFYSTASLANPALVGSDVFGIIIVPLEASIERLAPQGPVARPETIFVQKIFDVLHVTLPSFLGVGYFYGVVLRPMGW